MFRSLKRTHDLFVANQNTPVLPDETAYVFMHIIFSLNKLGFDSLKIEIIYQEKLKQKINMVLYLPYQKV